MWYLDTEGVRCWRGGTWRGPAHLPPAHGPPLGSATPCHTQPCPRPTSAKLAAWRCQPSLLSPPLPLRPQKPPRLWPPPSTGVPGTLPLSHSHDCSLPHPLVTRPNPPAGCGPEGQQLSATQPPGRPRTAPTLCSAPRVAGGSGGGAVLPAHFQEAGVDWTHPSTGLGHPTPPPLPTPPLATPPLATLPLTTPPLTTHPLPTPPLTTPRPLPEAEPKKGTSPASLGPASPCVPYRGLEA